jgi:hypothetical protein
MDGAVGYDNVDLELAACDEVWMALAKRTWP